MDGQATFPRTALAFHGVSGMRGGRVLFAGMDFALTAGDAAVVTGPNGVGKSTLLRIGAGLLAPAAGRVARTGEVAWLGEVHALDPERPLGEALRFWAMLDGGSSALSAMELDRLASVPVRLLSTGQRRRAAIARVLGSGAALWLLDEPLNGLDADGRALFERHVAGHRAHGGAVLIATHQPLALADMIPVRLG